MSAPGYWWRLLAWVAFLAAQAAVLAACSTRVRGSACFLCVEVSGEAVPPARPASGPSDANRPVR